jgi:Ribonuclease G/E
VKGNALALGDLAGRAAAAWIKDGRLHDLIVDPPASVPRRGTVMVARVVRDAPGIGGQFVELPEGRGFLRGGTCAPGATTLVQVAGYAEPGKAVPVSSKLELRGRYLVATPGAPGVNMSRRIQDPERRAALLRCVAEHAPHVIGGVVRSEAADATEDELRAECHALSETASRIAFADLGCVQIVAAGLDAHAQAAIEWPRAPVEAFEAFEVDDLIAAMQRPEIALGSSSAVIEPTRALVAVDVNTGADTSPAAALKANLALAAELPRQLRCRGLGGQIVIDLVPLRKSDRARVQRGFEAAFQSEGVRTQVAGWSSLGLLELSRSRTRFPL